MLERVKQAAWVGWLPSAGGTAALIASCVYFFMSQSSATRKIADLELVSRQTVEIAGEAETTSLSSSDIEALKTRHDDLKQRLADAARPGLVVPELTESARAAGLALREIRGGPKRGGNDPAAANPTYQVSVAGNYRQIAEYMQLCKLQRIPARVTSFRVTRATNTVEQSEAALEAEITVEVFVPQQAAG